MSEPSSPLELSSDPDLLSPPIEAAPVALSTKISMALHGAPPTVVHRTQFKSRLSLISLDKGVSEFMPEPPTPPSSAESTSNSGKSSAPGAGQSTEKTSLDSKFSKKSAGTSQHSSENKKATSPIAASDANQMDGGLTPIAESYIIESPQPIPSKLCTLPSVSHR